MVLLWRRSGRVGHRRVFLLSPEFSGLFLFHFCHPDKRRIFSFCFSFWVNILVHNPRSFMERNVGEKDRKIRIIAGSSMIGAGLMLLITAFTRCCCFYKIFRFSTCKKEEQEKRSFFQRCRGMRH